MLSNRKDQMVKRPLHQVLIKDDDKMRAQASALETGANIFIHGYLRTEFRRNQDEKLRAIYYVRPKKIVVSQQRSDNFAAGET